MTEHAKATTKKVSIGIGATGVGIWALLDPVTVTGYLNDTLQSEIGKFTIAFTIAAWVHAKQMKRDSEVMAAKILSTVMVELESFKRPIVNAVDELKNAVKDFDNHINETKNLISRVEALEKPKERLQ